MTHTYIFKEGVWTATGTYYDAANRPTLVKGGSTITHTGNFWINDSFMTLLLDQPVELKNRYEITPFSETQEFTNWESHNPVLGTLIGKFMMVGDSIISVFQSVDSAYTGAEYLLKIDDSTYQNRGFAFNGNEKLSSWMVELKRL